MRSTPLSPERARLRFAGFVTCLLVAALGLGGGLGKPPPVSAAGSIQVVNNSGLTVVGSAFSVSVSTAVYQPLEKSELVVRLAGPGRPSAGSEQLPLAASFTQQVGDKAGNLGADLATTVTVPGTALPNAGAYLLTMELRSAGVLQASGQLWVGKIAASSKAFDLAFVWPVALGIHRDAA
jgi:hypothetical protein